MALAVSRTGVRRVCTGAEYSTSARCSVIHMALALFRVGLRHACTEAEYSTSICRLVVHKAAAASCGGAVLERKECDGIFEFLQKRAAEM